MIAGVVGGLAAVVLWRRGGIAYVNLDSVLHDPRGFSLYVVTPVLLACVCVVAALPRLIAVNLAVLVGGVIVLELGAWGAAAADGRRAGAALAVDDGPGIYVPDERLGYRLQPSAIARHRRTVAGREIYDVTYKTDVFGRRQTPAAGGARGSFVLFFGDSNVFGEGLSQAETLPYFLAERLPDYRVYNYAVPGYGPAQLLVLAGSRDIRAEITEQDGYGVFLLIPAHVSRVIGSSRVSTGWGRHFPYYVAAPDGSLATRGDFTHARPWTTLAYFLWSRSALAGRLGLELPLWYSERDYDLTARVLKEAIDRLSTRLTLRRFVVVLAQVYDDAQRRTMAGVRRALERHGVVPLDYTAVIDPTDRRFRLAEDDYHFSAAANQVIASRLASDLAPAATAPAPPPGVVEQPARAHVTTDVHRNR